MIEDKSKNLKIKLKFFKVNQDEEEDTRLILRFVKKQGDI